MGKGRGGGKTPERVVQLLKEAVEQSSQVVVAEATGLTRLTVQRYLKGIGEPSQASLEKIAAYFGKPVAWLRGEEEEIWHTSNFNRTCTKCGEVLLVRYRETTDVEGNTKLEQFVQSCSNCNPER